MLIGNENIAMAMFAEDRSPPPQNINVTVNGGGGGAAQAAKLLKDLEDEAKTRLGEAISVGGNGFECKVFFYRDCMSAQTVGVAKFALNGRKLEAQAASEDWDQSGPEVLINKLMTAMSIEIAKNILAGALSAADIYSKNALLNLLNKRKH